ncbi:MAG: putA, partial [Ilumatobacteraceae bacterium]|nr:putA [Ilumatobacteraceae bacterium]
PEVSEAIDFARYDAAAAIPGEAAPYGVVVVAAPWNFPYAIPAGGVFAALMAGNAVVLKPAPEVRRTAWHLANQCWRAGVPRDVLQFVACPDDDVGRRLITHPHVATVVLTGAHATAQLFLDWEPSLRLLAETSGKNAIVVTESADVDAAIRDIVRSAFGHAGQKCSAASLVILTVALYDDDVFVERLAAAVRTLQVGEAADPATTMGPLILPPGPTLLRGLTQLDSGERWLVQPRQLDPGGRLWSPGVRVGVRPGSWFHVTECFGPVLGVMRADDLDHAIELQNGTPFGLTGGIHALDEHEVERWLERVEVGNAYVNRHITGAIVRRQPFGGWKRSSVGGGPKAGGPNYVAGFVRPPVVEIDPARAAESYAAAWASEFGVEHDPSGVRSEANVLRYRPLRHVVVRVGDDTPAGALEAAGVAAARCGVRLTVSEPDESIDTLVARLPEIRPERLRLITTSASGEPHGPRDVLDGLRRACHALDIAVDATPISADGRFELVHWVREQTVSITRHRYGRING